MFNTFKTKLTSDLKGALTKDGQRVDIKTTVTISSTYKNIFHWIMANKEFRKLIKENQTMGVFLSGHLRLELTKVNLENIDNFKFNLPIALTKIFKMPEAGEITHKFIKINSIEIILPEGVAENLAEKRQDRNDYLDEILNV